MSSDLIKVTSLYKAVKLLEFFTRANPEHSLAELSTLSGMGKSSVYNIMSTFEACGFIQRNPKTRQYMLGHQILHLSNCLLSSSDIRKIIHPYLEKICEFTHQNVYFAIPSNYLVLYMDSVFPNLTNSSKTIVGNKVPMYCTGIGKAMLAYMPNEAIAAVTQQDLLAYTPNTIITADGLYQEMQKIRERGYSLDNMEHEYAVKCVAIPLINGGGNIIGAISSSGASSDFTDEKVAAIAKFMKSVQAEVTPIIKNVV